MDPQSPFFAWIWVVLENWLVIVTRILLDFMKIPLDSRSSKGTIPKLKKFYNSKDQFLFILIANIVLRTDNKTLLHQNLYAIFTSIKDATFLRWLNPRSRCFNLVHLRRLSTLANLFLLKSRVSTAGRSCNDSSISTKPLRAHEINDSLFQCGEFFISAILLANICLRASCKQSNQSHNQNA